MYFGFSFKLARQNLPGTIEKSDLANQVRPQQAFKVFKKVMKNRANSRPGETYPYIYVCICIQNIYIENSNAKHSPPP